jgi:hypothetical protein
MVTLAAADFILLGRLVAQRIVPPGKVPAVVQNQTSICGLQRKSAIAED